MTELRDLIRKIIADHPGAQPAEIARDAAKLTPADRLLEFYEEALEPLVADILRQDRNSAMNTAKTPAETPAEPRRKSSPSRSGFVSRWQRMLAQTVHTERGFVPLAQITEADCDYCISERQAHIADVQARIEDFQTFKTLMRTHGVATLGEVPEQEGW